MARKKNEEVEVPLVHRISEARYLLAQYVPHFKSQLGFFNPAFPDEKTEPVFRILDTLDGPEIPDGLTAGDYLVVSIARKFRVTAHTAETIYTTTELK